MRWVAGCGDSGGRVDQTRKILTTRKLQSLLDACVNVDLPNRRALANAMSAAGSRISVHGVDAWFKRNDSNYALERKSLHSVHRSYAIPTSRWATVLKIFNLKISDLDKDDESFRDWVYALNQTTIATPQIDASIALCFGVGARIFAMQDGIRLQSKGYEVFDEMAGSDLSDRQLLKAMKTADVVLLYLDREFVRTQVFVNLVSVIESENLVVMAIFTDIDGLAESMLPGFAAKFVASQAYAQALDRRIERVVANTGRKSQSIGDWGVQDLVTTRPSIAVLPFANFTGDEAWNQLADAMAEDITLILARLPELFVISSSTMRVYQGRLPDSREVAKDLGVRYVLEGTIRVATQDKVRVTAQLVDATIRRGMWSNRFDRSIDAPSAVLDDLTIAICAQLEPKIRSENIQEGSLMSSAPAWRLWQEGWHYLFLDAPIMVPTRSIELFQQALKVDPDYPLAHAGYSIALSTGMLWGGLDPASMPEAEKHAEIAYKRLPENAATNYAMGMVSYVKMHPLQQVIGYMKKAVDCEPSNAMYHAILGYLLGHAGDTQKGLERARYAMRLSPNDARQPFLCYMLGNALIADGQYQEAIDTFAQTTQFSEVDFVWLFMAYAYFRNGDLDKSLVAVQRIDKPRPKEFYRNALINRMWLGHAVKFKDEFLTLIASVTSAVTDS